MKKKRSRPFTSSLLLVMFGSFLLESCTKQIPAPQSKEEASNTVLIGTVDSTTGNEATFGVGSRQGTELAFQEVNETGGIRGKKLKLVTADAQGKADEGTRALSKVIHQDHVVSVLTSVLSSMTLAMAPIAQKSQIPLVATGATNPKVTEQGDYIFRACFIDSFQGEVMAKFALKNLKAKKVAVLRDIKSDYSLGLADAFISVLKSNGGTIILEQSYSSGDIDFKSQLTAIRGKNPDALFIPGYYTDVALIARQARELGIRTTFLGGDGWDSPKLKEIAGEAIHGSYFSGFYSSETPAPNVRAFVSNYKKTFGIVPDGAAAVGYDGALVLIDAMKRAKSFLPADIREALAHTQNVAALNGQLSINAKRDAAKPAIVLKINNDGQTEYFETVRPN